MSALKPEDILFPLKNRTSVCILPNPTSMLPLQYVSKLTAGKDRHFFFSLPWLYKTSPHQRCAVYRLADKSSDLF
jgi:hypothetical protein